MIIDFLKCIHKPTPPDVKTYQNLGDYYWRNVIKKFAIDRQANVITIVIDKTNFLPAIRGIIHEERKMILKSVDKQCTSSLPADVIYNDSPIPHGSQYTKALQNPDFKSNLVLYICNYLLNLALFFTNDRSITFIIDSDAFCPPLCVQNGKSFPLLSRNNNKGEADYSIWFHASQYDCPQV